MIMEQKRILMMAGGTGGHIFPALAIADEMKRRNFQVTWLGTKKGMESRLVPENNYPIEFIDITGLRGKGLISLLTIPYKILRALVQTFLVFRRIKPDLTIGMGGFVSGPGGLISWLMGRPLVIHEQNAISGLSNNLLSIIAKQCLCAFPNAFKGFLKGTFFEKIKKNISYKITGNPVRKEILAIAKDKATNTTKNSMNILVIGGSLGAQKINEMVPKAIQSLQLEKTEQNEGYQIKYKVRHQCGKGKIEQVKNLISGIYFQPQSDIKIDYHLEEFISDMAGAYKWADLIICRSGALTVSEITVVGIASILIPFPYAVDDHQTENAKYITENNAGFLMPEDKLNAESLKQIIKQCDFEKLDEMAMQAKKLAKPNATIDVTEECLSWINKNVNANEKSEIIK